MFRRLPDFNSIENVWSFIKFKLKDYTIKNKKDLGEKIKEILNSIPVSYIKSSYHSFP